MAALDTQQLSQAFKEARDDVERLKRWQDLAAKMKGAGSKAQVEEIVREIEDRIERRHTQLAKAYADLDAEIARIEETLDAAKNFPSEANLRDAAQAMRGLEDLGPLAKDANRAREAAWEDATFDSGKKSAEILKKAQEAADFLGALDPSSSRRVGEMPKAGITAGRFGELISDSVADAALLAALQKSGNPDAEREAAKVGKRIATRNRTLGKAYADLDAQILRLGKTLEAAQKNPTPGNIRLAQKAAEKLERLDPLADAANAARAYGLGGKEGEEAAARSGGHLHRARSLARQLRPKFPEPPTLTAYGKRQEDRRIREEAKRKARQARRAGQAEARRARKEATRERRKKRHNRRAKEREQIEQQKRDARAEGKKIAKLGRSLGLEHAKGIGVAMVAHIASLSPQELARFLATPNHIGFTDEAVRLYQEMVRQREEQQRAFLAEARREMQRQAATPYESFAERAPGTCFTAPREYLLRWASFDPTPMGRGRAAPFSFPFSRAETIAAIRAVYGAAVGAKECATGVTNEDVFIASRLSETLKGLPTRGWVSFSSSPGRKVVFHLPTRVRALFGDMRPLTTENPTEVASYDLEKMITTIDYQRGERPRAPREMPAVPMQRRRVVATETYSPMRRRVMARPIDQSPRGGLR